MDWPGLWETRQGPREVLWALRPLGTAHSLTVLWLGPTRDFRWLGMGWSWDGGLSESSDQKPQQLVNVGVPSCPAAPLLFLLADG